ncbi:hypothetical protein Cni_G05362 [Canna indica]|uniref:Uncharacterized protein n=1 Tax=Canna indica TaxID=4628 RepID=A0AAQ3Q4X3_9LILI|nr:hypothetical protein Cni_G05362 [Canna indica]
MESRPLRFGGIGQLFPEFLPDGRVPRIEVVSPQPRRAMKVWLLDCAGGLGSTAKCILPSCHGDHNNHNFLDMFFDKDESEDDLNTKNQTGFFCGSPPVRTNNPVVWDALFAKENLSLASPQMRTHETRNAVRLDRSPHSCGSSFEEESDRSPQIRTEGFACANPGPGLVVSARS